MALELFRPRGLMKSPFRDIEDVFGRMMRDWPFRGEGVSTAWTPEIDLIDKKDALVFRADLPGLEQKDIDVSVQNGVLTVRGERKQETEEKEDSYYYCERSYGSFVRSVTLPNDVDQEKVKATFKSGVLEVTLPKLAQAKAKKVDIKGE